MLLKGFFDRHWRGELRFSFSLGRMVHKGEHYSLILLSVSMICAPARRKSQKLLAQSAMLPFLRSVLLNTTVLTFSKCSPQRLHCPHCRICRRLSSSAGFLIRFFMLRGNMEGIREKYASFEDYPLTNKASFVIEQKSQEGFKMGELSLKGLLVMLGS